MFFFFIIKFKKIDIKNEKWIKNWFWVWCLFRWLENDTVVIKIDNDWNKLINLGQNKYC